MLASVPPVVWRVLAMVVGAYLALCILVYFIQRSLIYFPDESRPATPSGAQSLQLSTADGETIEAWYWQGTRPLDVLLFHGNAGHRGHRLVWARRIRSMGYGVMLPDYRGYGGSTGSPSEEGLYQDGEACMAWLKENGRPVPVLFGSSLGCGVAVEMARRHEAPVLVLQSGYTSMTDVGGAAYPFLPTRLLLKDRFDNLDKIGDVKCPLLCLHGEDDDIIPMKFGRRLYEAAHQPKRWVQLADTGHNDMWDAPDDGYWAAVSAFLDERAAD